MTTTAKKMHRGHLLRAAKAGRLWLKCRYHLTDDYAYDAAENFGCDTEFRRAYVREPFAHPLEDEVNAAYAGDATHDMVEPMMARLRILRMEHDLAERDRASGGILLSEYDFRYKTGYCTGTTFAVYSNLVYDYEVR